MKRPSNKKIIETMKESRGIKRNIAKRLGVARNTLDLWIKADAELQEALEDAIENAIDIVEDKLFDTIEEGDTGNIRFFLKTRAKSRGYVETLETKDVSDKPRVMMVMSQEDIDNEKGLE